MPTPRSGTLVVKTVDATLDVVMRDQLRHLTTTSLAPVTMAAGDTGRLDRVAAREGVPAHALALARDPSPTRDLRALLELVRLMRQLRPETVVYGTPKATLLAGVAARLTGVPTRVQVLHGLRLETAHGIWRRLLVAAERLSMTMSTHTLAVGHGLRRRCGELGLPTTRIDVVGAGSVVGTDVARATAIADDAALRASVRGRWGLRGDEFVIGFVGRVTRDKGIETLVRAVADVRDSGIPAHLVLIGLDEGVDLLDDDVRTLLRSDWVTMTGNVDDPAEQYSGFDVFCLPSHREGLPTVVLEAWATRLPVVASDCTGLADLVAHGQTGLVVPVGDRRATGEALRAVATDRSLRRAIADGGHRRAVEDFDRSVVWDAFTRYVERARSERRESRRGRRRRP
ncbi:MULTISPECIES: glycosyltransferase [unclassified Curtobacterium]|uniref:glycosyltransferase n=1 Tax=unclassified Curtobacterium TaxID=257496 RepID=UPI0015E8A99B|nr:MULTISPECIES: glycosyltransferase [unclassified Curtobacterium]